jgi:hypothetical protein
VHKSLPFYYITTLWLVAIVSVFLIVRPLVISMNEKSNFIDFSDLAISGEKNNTAENTATADLKNESNAVVNDSGDLIFYDKTAFIRYFGDQYTEEELTNSYNKAVADKSNPHGKALIRVVRKGGSEKAKKSFSGSFDIKPVPVSKN